MSEGASSREGSEAGESSEGSVSWYFSDNGLGTSIENDSDTLYSSTQQYHKQVSELRILQSKLTEEENKLLNLLERASRQNKFDEDRIHTEREILASALKTRILLDDFRHHYERSESNSCNLGSVTISNVKLQCSDDSSNRRQYFLCSLTSKSKLYMSDICQPDCEGVVNFNINHTFLNLPVDFEISMKIFVLTAPRKSFSDKLRKLLFGCVRRTPETETRRQRESFFQFWKETPITIRNVNQPNEVFLDLVDFSLWKIVFSASGTVDTCGFKLAGWMDISRNGLFWNQHWCLLQGTILKCFNYPVQNDAHEPTLEIDLKGCLDVRIARPNETSRSRVIILDMDDDTKYPYAFCLSTTSQYEFKQWRCLEKLIPTLHHWSKVGSSII